MLQQFTRLDASSWFLSTRLLRQVKTRVPSNVRFSCIETNYACLYLISAHALLSLLSILHNLGSCEWTLKRNTQIAKAANNGEKIRTKQLFPLAKVWRSGFILRTCTEQYFLVCSTYSACVGTQLNRPFV